MDREFERNLRGEVIRIGSWLIKNISSSKTGSVYNGVGGIVLYFLSLYQYTCDKKYLRVACERVQWMDEYYRNISKKNLSFLTGHLSLPWVLLQIYHVTKEYHFVERALVYARELLLEKRNTHLLPAEFLSGKAGIMLVMLHLHSVSKEAWLLKVIDRYVEDFLMLARYGDKGMYWDRTKTSVHGLCGLSHGSGGIGWVFLEVGKYFQNPAFYWLAKQAFIYEDQYYSHQVSNWLDFRKPNSTEEDREMLREPYEQGDLAFFTAGRDMNAWCHGAAGIGLIRLRAYEILGDETYRDSAIRAIQKTINTTLTHQSLPSFTLCHGCGGNAELFIEAARLFKSSQYFSLAKTVAKRAFKAFKRDSLYLSGIQGQCENISLFLGTTGIGYFYLRTLAPTIVPSILFPKLEGVAVSPDKSTYPFIRTSLDSLKSNLCRSAFPETLEYINRFKIELSDSEPFSEDIEFVKRKSRNWPAKVQKTFNFELRKFKAERQISSNVLLHYMQTRKIADAQRLIAISDHDLLLQNLVIDYHFQIFTVSKHLDSDNSHGISSHPVDYHLLIPSLKKVRTKAVSHFVHTVLSAFQNETLVQDAVQHISDFIEITLDQREKIQQIILQQIREAIQVGILIDSNRHPINRELTNKNKISKKI